MRPSPRLESGAISGAILGRLFLSAALTRFEGFSNCGAAVSADPAAPPTMDSGGKFCGNCNSGHGRKQGPRLGTGPCCSPSRACSYGLSPGYRETDRSSHWGYFRAGGSSRNLRKFAVIGGELTIVIDAKTLDMRAQFHCGFAIREFSRASAELYFTYKMKSVGLPHKPSRGAGDRKSRR